MNRDELAAMVLAEVARQCDAIRNRPKPPAWKTWEALPDDDREYGPRYSPTWFGDATATEAGRVRLLRTVYRLADAGLLTLVKSEGGRLERVRLTKAGHKAAAPRPHPRRNPGAGRHRRVVAPTVTRAGGFLNLSEARKYRMATDALFLSLPQKEYRHADAAKTN